jgi:membrane protease YdiL (CAAX protease family)
MDAPQTSSLPPNLPPLGPGRTRRGVWAEVLGAFSLTVLVIAALVQLGRIHPLLLELASLGAALVFLYSPGWFLRREGVSPEQLGMHGGKLRVQLAWAVGTCIVVFPLFVAGFHVVQTQVLGRSATVDSSIFLRWPEQLDGRPNLESAAPARLWLERDTATVVAQGAPGEAVHIEVRAEGTVDLLALASVSDGRLTTRSPSARSAVERTSSELRWKGVGSGGLRFSVAQARAFDVEVRIGGERVAGPGFVLGRQEIAGDGDSGVRTKRGWLWLVWLVLGHLVAVALPEEVFYRGFVQSRFDQLYPPRLRLLGARVGPGLLFTSLLFGLGHYLVELDPTRFEVFFPSLLFGYLRNRTDSIAAAAIVHGLSNVLLALVSRAYA